MSGDNYKFQLSFKFGPGGIGMFNVRADTEEELVGNMSSAVGRVGEAAVLVEAYNTEFAAISNLAQGGFQVQAGQTQQGGQRQQASAGEICQHGSMTWRTGTGNNGPWKGWFCPADKNDPSKCKAKYIR